MIETTSEVKSDTCMNILIVDDEENILRSLRRLLMEESYEVFTASSGLDALSILNSRKNIALIVSDHQMPGISGVEFLEKAKTLAPDALRILLTGNADINDVADAINKGGAYRYIAKPWEENEFLQIVKEAVNRFNILKENKKLHAIVKEQNDELKNWNSELELRVQQQTLEIKNQNDELEQLNKSLKDNFKNSILAFSGLIELRNRVMANHSKNVAEISVRLARAMNLSDEEIETITIASLLHDIGKIGIPDVLLMKEPDTMDRNTQQEYMKHSIRGQAAIDSVETLRKAGVLIRHHHEWYNGAGFPDKLSGEKIPLGSRIIAIADYIERTGRKVTADNIARITFKRIKKELGTRFDPGLYPYCKTSIDDILTKIALKSDISEMELGEHAIEVGMVVSRDIQSGTGLILLSKGSVLNEKNIQALKRYCKLDPLQSGIFVKIEE